MSFSERLRERREELNMRQGELAKKLGVTVSAISNYEGGISFPKEPVLLQRRISRSFAKLMFTNFSLSNAI